MKKMTVKLCSSLAVSAAIALGACGSSAVGLKHTVPEKELVGLSSELSLKVEAAKGDVARAKDVFEAGDFEVKTQQKDVEAVGSQTETAADAVEAAADSIEATDDKQATELRQAQAKRDQQIAEAKKRYADESAQIRDRYAKLQTQNRAGLATAKRTQEVLAAQKGLEQAELAQAKAQSAVKKQEVTVAKAQLEVVKLDAVLQTRGVVGAAETAKKATFDQQLVAEQKKLAELQAKLEARVKVTETAKGKLEQAKTRATAPK